MSKRVIGFADRNERRDQRRPVEGIEFAIGGRDYEAVDLSLRGFRLSGYDGEARPGDKIKVQSVTVAGGASVSLGAKAQVVRVNQKQKSLAGTFIDLSSRNFDILEKLLMGRPIRSRPIDD